ncbi:MAG: hypothetical protein ACFNXV_06965 [Pauljensenia sp.]
MSVNDEPHRTPSPPGSPWSSGEPSVPRALSIDEEWAVMMALEEERGRGRTSEPPPVGAPAAAHEDLSYLEPIVNPPSSTPVNPWRAPAASPVSARDRWRWRWWRLCALPSLAFLAAISVVVVRLYGLAVDRGDPKSLIMPFLFLGTLWWNCVIHALYVACVRRMNPSVGFHVGAAIAAFVVSSVAAFVCVWVFVTAVNLSVVSGA